MKGGPEETVGMGVGEGGGEGNTWVMFTRTVTAAVEVTAPSLVDHSRVGGLRRDHRATVVLEVRHHPAPVRGQMVMLLG